MTSMNSQPNRAPIGLLLSGGLDSCILLGDLLRQGRPVQPLYVHSDLVWQEAELRHLRQFVRKLNCPALAELVILHLPLADVYGTHWAVTGRQTPDAASADQSVYLPGRNPLLAIKAVLWCQLHHIDTLALGVLGSSPFADASPAFFEQFAAVMATATGNEVRIVAPFAQRDKQAVMSLGRDLPLHLTFSCIAPVHGLHCGRCNKCAERQHAFELLGITDPTLYAPSPVVP
jgi:7-cyano-7-deazaguanine synthase